MSVEDKQEKHNSTDLRSRSGEILPDNIVKRWGTDTCNRYIVDSTEDSMKTSEISPKAAVNEENENLPENPTWFQKPTNCISKWLKALKLGVVYSMGLNTNHTASMNQEEDDKHSFSFFL